MKLYEYMGKELLAYYGIPLKSAGVRVAELPFQVPLLTKEMLGY